MVAGAWFLCREVELSTTRARLVTPEKGPSGEASVRWCLPASKNDVEAMGVSRVHGCSCGGGLQASCPYHAAEIQLLRLKRLFPSRWTEGVADWDLPLFPTKEGNVVMKEKMAATILEAARRLEVVTELADGSARVTGHSLRVSGAQGLARAGLEV